MQMFNWMAVFEEKRREDHQELLGLISDVGSSQIIIQNLVASQTSEISQMMQMMQMVTIIDLY